MTNAQISCYIKMGANLKAKLSNTPLKYIETLKWKKTGYFQKQPCLIQLHQWKAKAKIQKKWMSL